MAAAAGTKALPAPEALTAPTTTSTESVVQEPKSSFSSSSTAIAAKSPLKEEPKASSAASNKKLASKARSGFSSSPSQRVCAQCRKAKQRSCYSRNQWRKLPGQSRCSQCLGNNGAVGKAKQNKIRPPYKGPPIPESIASRPQRKVPGFEEAGLTCCRDWPQTKSGRPPGAQSAIYTPLITCAIGPIEGHCSAEQIDWAMRWWTEALPAWPTWVAQLQKAGIALHRQKLIQQAKGQPNPLVHKGKGRGTAPHYRGRMQTDVIEQLDMQVLVELESCIHCLYSAKTLDSIEHDGHSKSP